MTIAEAEKFYKNDAKGYELGKNKDFLCWLKSSIKNGYHCFADLEDLQSLINNIVTWYQIKYPERELARSDGVSYLDFEDLKDISDVMSIEQLFLRLPSNQLRVMKCEYRASGGGMRPLYKNGKKVGLKPQIFMRIDRKEVMDKFPLEVSCFLLTADNMTGEIFKDSNIDEFLEDEDSVSLEELLQIFNKKYKNKLDYSELKKCVYDHDSDLELRHRILQLVALKLLYSKNTTPERGYERAKRFINEFNGELGLTLSTDEIDKIFDRDYTDGEVWEEVLETYTDKSGEERSYWTVKNTAGQKAKSVKNLVKSLFKGNNK